MDFLNIPGFAPMNDTSGWNGLDSAAYDQNGNLIWQNSTGETPFIGIPDGGNYFASSDPDEIARYQHNARTRALQGIAQIATLVGGGAALGGWLGGGSAAAGTGLSAGGGVLAAPAATAGTAGIAAGAPIGSALMAGTGVAAGAPLGALAGLAPGAGVFAPGAGVLAPGVATPSVSGVGSAVGNAGGGALSKIPGWLNNWGSLITGGLGLLDSLNQPDSLTQTQGGTSTSTSGMQLPAELTGAANQGLQGLLGLFNQGYQRAPISPLIGSASSRLSSLGSNPFATGANFNAAPTMTDFANPASGYLQNALPTASKFAGGQTINPYLDQVFNTAADATQNRAASEFAHAGRLNTGSHQQTRSQELQNLAAGIYAPGFESERQRQYGAAESDIQRQLAQREANLGRQFGAMEAGVDRGLSQMDANLGRQYGAIESNLGRDLSRVPLEMALGDYMTQFGQQEMDAPWMNLQRLLGGLGGLAPFYPGTQTQSTTQTGNVTQPLFSNPLAGFLGGAQLGRGLFGG
jgi:hypothetical protein